MSYVPYMGVRYVSQLSYFLSIMHLKGVRGFLSVSFAVRDADGVPEVNTHRVAAGVKNEPHAV